MDSAAGLVARCSVEQNAQLFRAATSPPVGHNWQCPYGPQPTATRKELHLKHSGEHFLSPLLSLRREYVFTTKDQQDSTKHETAKLSYFFCTQVQQNSVLTTEQRLSLVLRTVAKPQLFPGHHLSFQSVWESRFSKKKVLKEPHLMKGSFV